MVLIVGCRFSRKLVKSMQLKSACVKKCLFSLIVFHGILVTESCKNAAFNYAVWIQSVSHWNRWRWNVTSSSFGSVSTAFHFWLQPVSRNRHFTWRTAWITAHISNITVACHYIDLGSVPGQSVCNFWWTECQLGSTFFYLLYLPLSESFHYSCVESCKRK